MDSEIFRLFEATIANVKRDHPANKDLRRDQLLLQYDEAEKSLETLIKAKEHEVAYRRDLVDMLEKSKLFYDTKMMRVKHAYQTTKKHAPAEFANLEARVSTTPPLPAPYNATSNDIDNKIDLNTSSGSSNVSMSFPMQATSTNVSSNLQPTAVAGYPMMPVPGQVQQQQQKQDLGSNITLPSDNYESRSSLDRRLSEILKTYPQLAQSGIASSTGSSTETKPTMLGYYTQQPTAPAPISGLAPPMMAMLRFPPPNMIAPPHVIQPVMQQQPPPPPQQHTSIQQDNHDSPDMDLSEDESGGTSSATKSNPIPMIATALQQGGGGPKHSQSYYNNPSVPYAPRLNALPFDPSIMDPSLSSGEGGKMDSKHISRQRHGSGSSSSSGGGLKHSSDKSRYSSSSSSSSRSKRR